VHACPSSILVEMKRHLIALALAAGALSVACGGEARDDVCVSGREDRCAPQDSNNTATSAPSASSTPATRATVEATVTPAVSATPTSVAAAGAGTLTGYVHIGPTCPVVREGDDCADRPHEAELDVLDAGGALVLTLRSATDGTFGATLAPGSYRLVPRITGRLPYAVEQFFFIEGGETTHVDVPYDSGIR
jgi:hypothetical protein